MGGSHHDEVERKYDVAPSTVFPDLAPAEGVASVGQPAELRLEAVYYDTDTYDLARSGITLRRRAGGTDDGWHLKLPAGKDTRTEIREPLGPTTEPVPDRLESRVRAVVRDRPLTPVAALSTHRREYPLRDAHGTVLGHVCDDSVHARALGSLDRAKSWREWEVELANGPESILDAVAEVLLAAGAVPSTTTSKLGRAIGQDLSTTSARPSHKALAAATAGHVLVSQLLEHTARLQQHDVEVRSGHPAAVHRIRIAARRLRSALTTFGPLLDRTVTDPVREDLRWLGQALADARDAQVLREHLGSVLSAQPPELVIGGAAVRIDDQLSAAHQNGLDKALAALDGDRYLRLLDALDALAAEPPMKPDGEKSAKKVLPRLLSRDLERLRRAVRGIDAARDPDSRDIAFHEARKKAKRLRYAAEAATPAVGKRSRSLASSAKKIQQLLGERQDSVAARHRLRECAVQAHLRGDNAFTIGRLHALEQARAERVEAEFATVWEAFDRKQLSRWAR